MIESRCGIICSECDYREKMNCPGCVAMDKPFWGDSCPVKDCCEGRGHEFCGLCADFPCEMLTQFAYDEEQGDNGKRLETCRMWAAQENTFNPEKFIMAVTRQDAAALRDFFVPDAVICWHDSNEQFSVEEYIRANCEYPGNWSGEIQRVDKIDGGMAIVTKISSGDFATFVSAFIKLDSGKISRLDEYYADYNEEIPDWRRKMNIGKPIS